MAYVKGTPVEALDYNTFAGYTGSAAASAAAAANVAGYLWGVGFGDRGYGQATPALAMIAQGATVGSAEWENLQAVLSNLASWQGTSTAGMPVAGSFAQSAVVQSDVGGAGLATFLQTLDTNRLNYQAGNMTLTASAASTTRGTTWGQGSTEPGDGITSEFSVVFASEDEARFFFNTGGEIRIGLNHPNTSTPQDQAWNTALNGFIASFRANGTVRTGGSFGAAQGIGYYQLTTGYQVIVDGSNVFTSAYTANKFYVDAMASSIAGANGAKGYQLQFRCRLFDDHANGFYDLVQAGTAATLGHLRATAAPLTAAIAAPTASVLTAF